MIADCRHIIKCSNKGPKKFSLPSLESLYAYNDRTTLTDVWFTTIDIKNAYHSLILPPQVSNTFRFSINRQGKVTCYKWLRLPFGWDKSPYIFNKLIMNVFEQIECPHESISLSFYDDVINASTSYTSAVSSHHFHQQALVDEGFLISEKSVGNPSKSVQWLGKYISSSQGIVWVQPLHHLVFSLFYALVFCFAKSWPAKAVQS